MKTSVSSKLLVLIACTLVASPTLVAGKATTGVEAQAIEKATGRLALLDKELDGLRGEIERTRGYAPAPPESVSRRLGRARPRVRDAVSVVFGLHWRQVEPVLAAAQAIEKKVADLEEQVKTWPAATAKAAPAAAPAAGSGAINGVVTDEATGLPIANVGIQVAGTEWRYVTSDTAGRWTVTGLGTGTYYAVTEFAPAGYVNEVFDNIPCMSYCDAYSGTPISVTDGSLTSGIDFTLQAAGSISGKVTAVSTGGPLDAIVSIHAGNDGSGLGSVRTDAQGAYRFTWLAAGTYFAKTYNQVGYANELYDGILCEPTCTVTTGTPIVVASGHETRSIDFSLARLGTFRGRVTDATTGFPLANTTVRAYASDGSLVSYDYANEYGIYGAGGLAAGTYFAVASSATHLDELYEDLVCQPSCDPTTGTPIAVTSGATTESIDFALGLGGGVMGKVTAAVSGLPLGGVEVEVFGSSGVSVASAFTNGQGNFVAGDLPTGSYFAWAKPTSTVLGQLYAGLPCDPSCTLASGTPIPVTVGALTPGVNFTLTGLGAISGTVRAEVASGFNEVYVSVYDATGNFVRYTTTGSPGAFEITGLQPGTYFARATRTGNLPQIYDGIHCIGSCEVTSGTPIEVMLNTVTGGIDFSLRALGKISGTITDAATGLPLPFRSVAAYDATGTRVRSGYPGATGAYTISDLPPGTYFVSTEFNSEYVDELWSNLDCRAPCDVTKGNPVVVALGGATAGIDFKLHKPYFADVGLDHWARRYIEGAYVGGVTSGCGTSPLAYCPDVVVNRWQMAVFLARAMAGSDAAVPSSGTVPSVGPYDCVAGGVSLFPNDVPPTDGGCRHVHYIYGKGVTSGCGPGSFCPGGDTTRWQTAVFMAIALAGSNAAVPVSGTIPGVGDYDCVAGGTTLFPNDVPATDGACRHVHYIYGQGLTAGCGPGSFCPSSTLTRDQMAVFLAKGFHLTKYGF